jgi:hypothetical protein
VAFKHGVEHPAAIFIFANIHLDEGDAVWKTRGRRFKRCAAATADHHICIRTRKALGHASADAGAASRDYHGLSAEIECCSSSHDRFLMLMRMRAPSFDLLIYSER